ncbi:MAG: hypothetical protein HUJ84_03690 [Veillonella sp.]|nr:hypothetical protein [Veillonella sp.]MCF0156428.1 hypothetical protein [Veillonella sp.]
MGRISSKEIDKNIEERMRDKAIKDSLIARIKAHPEIYPNYNPIDEYNEKTIWYMLDHLKGKLTIEPSDYLRDKESNKESLYFDGTLYSDNLGYYYVQIYGVTDSAKEKMNLELLDKIIKSISFTAMDVPLGAVRVK